MALLLSSIGILLLSGQGLDAVQTQIAAMILGIFLFCFLVWFLSDLDRVMKARLYIAIGAILLFVLNILIGTEYYGSKNWIVIGPISIQPRSSSRSPSSLSAPRRSTICRRKRTSRNSSCLPAPASASLC